MAKYCLIDNMASHYRKAIYILMDKEFDMDWYFGEPIDNIKELDLSLLKNACRLKNKTSILPHAYSLKGMGKLIDKYDKVIMNGEPALLSTWILLLRHLLFYPKKEVYFWTHGWYGKETFFKKIIKKIYFKMGTGVLTYGDYARDLMIREGFDPNKIWVIHNSLDYDKQLEIRKIIRPSAIYTEHFDNNNYNLLFIGRLTAVKRLDLIIESLALLNMKGQKYNMTFVGDGPIRESIEKQTKKYNLENQVWIYGECYDERTNAELIYNADLCVAPGNVGLTAIHALFFGTPVATHNNFPYQMPEFEAIHEDKTGTFFKQNDVNDIVCCISRWFVNHRNDRDAIRLACFKEIDDNWNPYFQIKVLKNLLNKY